jgi:hypothetical protein
MDEHHPQPRPKSARSDRQASGQGKARKQIDIAMLRALTNSMPMQSESASEFIRRMRDEERY